MGQFVSKNEIAAVKQITILDYLRKHEPHELVPCGKEYSTKTHSSLKIRGDGVWHWFSQSIGGKSALDYLIHVKGMGFIDAVQALRNEPIPTQVQSVSLPEAKPFQLPEHHTDNHRVRDYLHNRGIPLKVIDQCIEQGRIYESAIHHNAVFVGFDTSDVARCAMLRGTGNTRFIREVEGSDKRFSFSMPGTGSMLVITESAIDALSSASLSCLRGKDWRASHYLSMGGVTAQQGGLPLAIDQYLKDHLTITDVCLMLDNDKPGREMSDYLYRNLQEWCSMYVHFPAHGKDVNDELLHRVARMDRHTKAAQKVTR